MQRLVFLSTLITVFFSPSLYSQENAPFLVTIFDNKISVVSPERSSPNLHLVFHNKSISKIVGKVQTKRGRIVDYINLLSGETKSVFVGHLKKEHIFYYPLSPSFQATELIIGRKPYEIPPKKEN